MKKESGMGQTKNMSFVSSDEEAGEIQPTNNESSKLLKPTSPTGAATDIPRDSTDKSVDFFTDRDYWKIFLETSKEQTARIKRNSPFSGLKTWDLMRVIVKTNDDLR